MLRYFISIIGLLALACPQSIAAPLELTFPPGISWKQVFDSGFRPKHIAGLEAVQVECTGQEFVFRFCNKPGFKLDFGRLMFELQSDNSLRIIEHVSRVPISMEEGAKRMEIFHDLFSKELLKRGSVPPLMDKERGGVAALSDYYATAESEGYTMHYGYTGSFQPGKPLLPIFMIALRHNMEAIPLPIRRETVKPPEGYEWYSLDPKVSTPDPGSTDETLKKPKIDNSENETRIHQKGVDIKIRSESSKLRERSEIWIWVIGIIGFIVTALLVWLWKCKLAP